VIQTFPPYREHPAFRMRVRVGRPKRRLHHVHPGGAQRPVEVVDEESIAIMQYKPGRDPKIVTLHERVTGHLAHPASVRTEGRLGQDDSARLQVQDEQDINRSQPTERPYLLGEEIRAEHHVGVAREEFTPGQSPTLRRWRQIVAAQDVGDAALR